MYECSNLKLGIVEGDFELCAAQIVLHYIFDKADFAQVDSEHASNSSSPTPDRTRKQTLKPDPGQIREQDEVGDPRTVQDEDQGGTPLIKPSATIDRFSRHLFPAPFSSNFQKITDHTPANQVLMNMECYTKAIKLTMHPDRHVPVGRKITNGKGVYCVPYYKLGTALREQHEEVGRVFRAARMTGAPESEWPPIPMAYVMGRPTEVLLGDLSEFLMQTVAQQKPDF